MSKLISTQYHENELIDFDKSVVHPDRCRNQAPAQCLKRMGLLSNKECAT